MKMRKKYEPFLSKFRITQQILLVFFVCTVIPMLLLGFWGTRRAGRLLSEQYESLANADNARVKSILFDITTSIYTVTVSLTTSYITSTRTMGRP